MRGTPAWHRQLQPASFNGVQFHIEVGSRAGGRRIATHEFPKRDIPYTEDMGRKAKRFTVSAYLIGDDFIDQRNRLIAELEKESPGILILPTHASDDVTKVACEGYSTVERRQAGRFIEVEMQFVEAGQDIWDQTTQATDQQAQQSATQATGTNGGSQAYQVAQQYQDPLQNVPFNSGSSNVSDVASQYMTQQSPTFSFGFDNTFMGSSDLGGTF